jgi:hypothetical protein
MDENGGCFPTFNPPKILSSQVSWDSEPCRLWAFGVRGWIPFELRSNRWDDWSSRAPAPGGKFQAKTRFLRQFFMRYYLWIFVVIGFYYILLLLLLLSLLIICGYWFLLYMIIVTVAIAINNHYYCYFYFCD